MPGERQRKAALVHSFLTPSPHRSCYAGARLFDYQGKAQGRRGHRRPPHRFARPPYSRKGGPDGPPFRHSVFLFWTGRGPFSLFGKKRKWGADPSQETCASTNRRGRSLRKPPIPSEEAAAGYVGTTPTSPLPSSGPLRGPPSPTGGRLGAPEKPTSLLFPACGRPPASVGGRLSRGPSLMPASGGSAAAPRRRCPPPIPAGWRREWRKWWCCVALPDPRPSPAAPGTAAPATAPRPGPWGRPY